MANTYQIGDICKCEYFYTASGKRVVNIYLVTDVKSASIYFSFIINKDNRSNISFNLSSLFDRYSTILYHTPCRSIEEVRQVYPHFFI